MIATDSDNTIHELLSVDSYKESLNSGEFISDLYQEAAIKIEAIIHSAVERAKQTVCVSCETQKDVDFYVEVLRKVTLACTPWETPFEVRFYVNGKMDLAFRLHTGRIGLHASGHQRRIKSDALDRAIETIKTKLQDAKNGLLEVWADSWSDCLYLARAADIVQRPGVEIKVLVR